MEAKKYCGDCNQWSCGDWCKNCYPKGYLTENPRPTRRLEKINIK